MNVGTQVTVGQAQQVLRETYGVHAVATRLPGERDANFRVGTQDGQLLLFKVHHPEASRDEIDLENAVLVHLARSAVASTVPAVLPSKDGTLVSTTNVAGENRYVRLLSWVEGHPAGEELNADDERLTQVGRIVGAVDAALAQLRLPAPDRELDWDLMRAERALRHLDLVAAEKQQIVAQVLHRHSESVMPRLAEQPRQLIHNDGNENNIVLDERGEVVGLIDFGDIVVNPRVCGLAIAVAYAVQAHSEPSKAAARVVRGYHLAAPLSPAELSLVYDLACTRLAVSICMAAAQHAADPGNDYLLVSQQGIWKALQHLLREGSELMHLRVRDACGYEPVPTARAIRRYLQDVAGHAHPVIATDNTAAAPVILDLDRRSCDTNPSDPHSWQAWHDDVAARLEAGAPYLIGKYAEDRGIYAGPAFTDPSGQRRTIHLGIDLFTRPMEAVHACLSGRVVHNTTRPDPLDYGPVLVLEHRTDHGERFFTLYAHLDAASTTGLDVGTTVIAGQVIGRVGAAPGNGGWPPHVHVAVLTTLLNLGPDVPGVCAGEDFDVWSSVCPNPSLLLDLGAGTSSRVSRSTSYLKGRRSINFSPAVGLSYREPLRIVRGQGAHLFDETGRRYLDMVNNVAHVGHSHASVVEAANRQNKLLTTNTRYLHESIVDYGRALVQTLPEPLSVCFLVNSGSEANDLALRLARAATGSDQWLVLEHGYHGALSSTVGISGYKFNGPGGYGPPQNVSVCAQPDPYRGRFRDLPPEDMAAAYAGDVQRKLAVLQAAGERPGALIVEAIPSVGGQIVPPPGYLHLAFDHVRRAGGLVIADEVQTGLGRIGSHMWAFEAQGGQPDIVTMGKPLGNGHPLAAVVTTPQVAHGFSTGMEYFNTFGGNPVSSEVGLAVLQIVEQERLPQHAQRLGGRLLAELQTMAETHEVIGDVRGAGLFLGIEFVRDRDSRRPDPARATAVKESAKERGVLLSTDGPDNNVIKIKPPMALTALDCDLFLEVFDDALRRTEGAAPRESRNP